MTNFINKKNYKSIYTVALFAILFFVTVSIANMIFMISFHSQYAELINKSGKQRMLSQRITLLATQDLNQSNINKYIKEFQANHNFLLQKDLSDDAIF